MNKTRRQSSCAYDTMMKKNLPGPFAVTPDSEFPGSGGAHGGGRRRGPRSGAARNRTRERTAIISVRTASFVRHGTTHAPVTGTDASIGSPRIGPASRLGVPADTDVPTIAVPVVATAVLHRRGAARAGSGPVGAGSYPARAGTGPPDSTVVSAVPDRISVIVVGISSRVSVRVSRSPRGV